MASPFGCFKQRHKRIIPCTKSDVGYKNNNYYKSTNILFIHIILSFIDIINSSIRQAKYKKQVQILFIFHLTYNNFRKRGKTMFVCVSSSKEMKFGEETQPI